MFDKQEFEELLDALHDYAAVVDENTVMRQILMERLSYEDKRYYKLKYGIDLGV